MDGLVALLVGFIAVLTFDLAALGWDLRDPKPDDHRR